MAFAVALVGLGERSPFGSSLPPVLLHCCLDHLRFGVLVVVEIDVSLGPVGCWACVLNLACFRREFTMFNHDDISNVLSQKTSCCTHHTRACPLSCE